MIQVLSVCLKKNGLLIPKRKGEVGIYIHASVPENDSKGYEKD